MKVSSLLDIIGGIFLIAIVALVFRNATQVTAFVRAFQSVLQTALRG